MGVAYVLPHRRAVQVRQHAALGHKIAIGTGRQEGITTTGTYAHDTAQGSIAASQNGLY
jgi:hypothetical protein